MRLFDIKKPYTKEDIKLQENAFKKSGLMLFFVLVVCAILLLFSDYMEIEILATFTGFCVIVYLATVFVSSFDKLIKFDNNNILLKLREGSDEVASYLDTLGKEGRLLTWLEYYEIKEYLKNKGMEKDCIKVYGTKFVG